MQDYPPPRENVIHSKGGFVTHSNQRGVTT